MLDATSITFIGGGNMAAALISGLIEAGTDPQKITVAEPAPERRAWLEKTHGVLAYASNHAACQDAQAVVVAVKPGVVATVLQEAAPALAPETLVISIAAGVSLASLQVALPKDQPVIRVMPNTPALVRAGISALYPASSVGLQALELGKSILGAAGEVVVLEKESQMDAVTALSGSGPAYVYQMAEALSDGGVACGLPRPLATRLAVETLLGAATLMKASDLHPGALKDQVTSPGGTTIAGVAALEENGMRSALIKAVQAACERSIELGKG